MKCLAASIVAAVVATGTGCSHDRVLVTLQGDAPGATSLEIVIAEPYASRRLQRAAGTLRELEDTFYVAQRGITRFTLDPEAPVTGLQVQIEEVSREPFLPIAIARDAGGRIVAMGTLQADFVYVDGITPAAQLLADVTLYDLVLEPVIPAAEVGVGVPSGTFAEIACDGAPSGIAWRRASDPDEVAKPQLRLVLPLDDPDGSAIARLDSAVDLDCDGHSPGIGGLARDDGDKLDCDDLQVTTGPGAVEQCNGVDDDCNGALDGLQQVGADCPNVPAGCPNIKLCDEARADAEICVSTQLGCSGSLRCEIPFEHPDGEPRRVCNGVLGEFESGANVCGGTGCRVTLVRVDPRWDVRIGDLQNPSAGLFEPVMVDSATPLGIVAKSSTEFASADPDTGSFTVFVEPPMSTPLFATFDLDLTQRQSMEGCVGVDRFRCGAR